MKISRRHTRILADIRERGTRALVNAIGNDFVAAPVEVKQVWEHYERYGTARMDKLSDTRWVVYIHAGLHFQLLAEGDELFESAAFPATGADAVPVGAAGTPIPETNPDLPSGHRMSRSIDVDELRATLTHAVRHDLTGPDHTHTFVDPATAWACYAGGADLYEFPDPLYRVVESAMVWFTLSDSPLVLDADDFDEQQSESDAGITYVGNHPVVRSAIERAHGIAEARRQPGVGYVGDNPIMVVFDEASALLPKRAPRRSWNAVFGPVARPVGSATEPAAERPNTNGRKISAYHHADLVRFRSTTRATRYHRVAEDTTVHVAIDPDALHTVFDRNNDSVWHVYDTGDGSFTMIPAATGQDPEDAPLWYTATLPHQQPRPVGYTAGERDNPPIDERESFHLGYGYALGLWHGIGAESGITDEGDCVEFGRLLAERHDRQAADRQTPVVDAFTQWRTSGRIEP